MSGICDQNVILFGLNCLAVFFAKLFNFSVISLTFFWGVYLLIMFLNPFCETLPPLKVFGLKFINIYSKNI